MLTIIHGDDISSSRTYFFEQKDKDSLIFDAENLIIEELKNSLQGSSLFNEPKKIFIDNLFTKKGSKNYDEVSAFLTDIPADLNVFLWANKDLGVKILNSFPKHNNQNFKIPKNIFSFLDSIRPNNPRNVSSFHKTLLESDEQIIFAMIVRQFRLMIGLSEKADIEEVKRLAPWQKSKLMNQASMFEMKKLKEIYKKLYKIDKKQKTGATNLTLVQSIDILLLEI